MLPLLLIGLIFVIAMASQPAPPAGAVTGEGLLERSNMYARSGVVVEKRQPLARQAQKLIRYQFMSVGRTPAPPNIARRGVENPPGRRPAVVSRTGAKTAPRNI